MAGATALGGPGPVALERPPSSDDTQMGWRPLMAKAELCVCSLVCLPAQHSGVSMSLGVPGALFNVLPSDNLDK